MILDKNPFYEDKEINIYHINDYFIVGFKTFISKKINYFSVLSIKVAKNRITKIVI